MYTKDFTNLESVTIADFKVAIFNAETEMKNCLNNKNIKGFLEALKLKLKLNMLLDKKMSLVRKQDREIRKQR